MGLEEVLEACSVSLRVRRGCTVCTAIRSSLQARCIVQHRSTWHSSMCFGRETGYVEYFVVESCSSESDRRVSRPSGYDCFEIERRRLKLRFGISACEYREYAVVPSHIFILPQSQYEVPRIAFIEADSRSPSGASARNSSR